MSDELKKFLRFLFEADTGYVYSPCKKLTGEWNQRFFLWPSESEKVHDWITSSTHEGNVYLSPALFKEKAATKESFKTTNVAWVEFDGSTNIDFKEINQPDVIVQTSSPTHVHCYWKIKPANVESVENINRRLTYYLGADNSGWDCTQVLRPPGTLNHKYSKPIETLLVKFQPSFIKRDLSRFDKAPEIEKPPLIITYDSLLDPEKVIVENKLGIDLIKMIKSEFVKQGNHSTYLMRLGYLLGSSGLNEIEIISLLYLADSRIKKFVGRSDQLLRLSEIAAIATLEIHKELDVEGYSPLEIINHELTLTWLIKGWLHSYGIMIITGQPGVGKTQFSMDIAHKLATGESFLGREKTDPVRVAFLSLEMDILEAKYIFVNQAKDFGQLDSKDLWNTNLKVYAPELDSNSFAAYEKILKEWKPQVVIIDSLSELSAEDLKESEAKSIMRWLKRMGTTYGCAIILIHHNRKASDGNKKPRKLSDLYGSYIFAKTVSTVVSLWQDDGKNFLEIDQLKVRFGTREGTVKIQRTQHLTFKEYQDADKQSGKLQGNSNPLLDFL